MIEPVPDPAAHLRRRAEEIARQQNLPEPAEFKHLSAEEIALTLHELRVHQIELEMQNEELRRAQLELETSRARYFDLYDLAPVGYCTISEKGLILEANLTAAELLGVARSGLVRQPLSRFICFEDQDIYYRHRKHLFETEMRQECELRLRKETGAAGVVWVHLTAVTAPEPDGSLVSRVMLKNISERKQAEEKILSLNAELEQLALTDYLTHLYNRRYFMQRGAEEFQRSLRSRQPLALLMIDVDHFKSVNDQYGHEAGDWVLQQIAVTFKSSLREVDILGRWGGEEFVVLLPSTTLPAAGVLAERIQQSIADLAFQIPGTGLIHNITLSVGFTAFFENLTRIDDLLRNADAAMYRAKHSGRNCVCVDSEERAVPPV